MAKIDTWAIHKLGIPGTVLMENAGRGCVDVLENYFELEDIKALIICGKGNNGGDGFVVARHLANRGAEVEIALLGNVSDLKGDALLNYRIAKKAGHDIRPTLNMNRLTNMYRTFAPNVIIDAIFGTGFQGAPKGIYKRAIELVNSTEVFILSIDIPSGINGDDGQLQKTCIIADATATMCLPKRGNYLYPGRAFCGDLYTIDIGVPYELINTDYPQVTEYDDILSLIPYRPPDGNKGTFGQVLVVAGARGFSGAAAMAAHAALKVGAGLVRLAAPRGIMNALEAKLLEVVKIPLEQTAAETISPAASKTLRPILKTSEVVVIGPGMTTHPQTAEFISDILPRINVPMIIDADAINIIAQNPSLLKKIKTPFIMTPHPGELARLINMTPRMINRQRIDLALEYARKFNCVMVLKGAPTVIADPEGKTFVNPTGNSGLASAGSGDVLVGMIAGFLGQGQSPTNAAVTAVFLHGLCADLAIKDSNEYALTASDLIDRTPGAMNYLLRREFAD
jgi:NAD(P)H-hydrate epimerase